MDFLAAPERRTELRELFVDAPSDNLNHAGTKGVFLNETESEFFDAIKDLDTALVRSKLNDKNNPVNINAINSDGLTPLQLAAKTDNPEIIQELLDNGADLSLALLQCVVENDPESVEVLSSYAENIGISGDSYITPTILAAQLGHYEILNILIQNSHLIKEPHECECYCDECNQKSDMLRSQIAINRFRGLSSPAYMCLRYLEAKGGKKDPLTFAFELNTKVLKRSTDEPELKKEYLKLSERCKTFATDLYNGCRSMTEIMALLDIDEEQFDLSSGKTFDKDSRRNLVKKLRTAIESDHKEFVAHPNTQQLLNVAIYSGVPKEIHTRSFLLNMFLFILYTIFFPLLALLYIVHPHHWLSRMMSTPYLKFVSHLSQFLIFVILIVATAFRDNHIPSGLEYTIFITVFGMIVQKFREMLRHQPRMSFFFKWWNIVTTIMLILFLLAALLWMMGFTITGGWSLQYRSLNRFAQYKDGYELLLLGNSLFSLAIVVSVFHLVDLCQVNSVLGPLQLSLLRMLQDVLKFLLFFAGIFVAFVSGLRNLYSYYNSIQAEMAANDRNHTMVAGTNHPFSSFLQSTQSLFWALFGKLELEDFDTKGGTFKMTQETGRVLFGFYSICIIVVALNMLIAMMSHSYDSISQDDDIQWKFSRTQLWLEFVEKGSTLPAPYNLLPNPRAIYRFFKRKVHDTIQQTYPRFTGNCEEPSTRPQKDEKNTQAERKTIIKRLVRRYFLTQESQRKKELGTLKDIEDSTEEIIKALRESHAASTRH